MPMQNPSHPGGVTRPTLLRVINGRSAISPEMALRLSAAFGSTAEFWLRMQTAYDLAQARLHLGKMNVQRYEPASAAPSLQ